MMALRMNPVGMTKNKFMKLLIVEDNPKMRRLIRSVVNDLADSILECEDGADALQTYSDFHPDWVLMDVKMPKVDGLITTHNIIKNFPDAKVCIVTDYSDQKTIDAALKAGAKGYVLKENLYLLCEILFETQ